MPARKKPKTVESKPEPAEPWYAPGLRFECTQCGDCCTGPPGYVWFDEDEGAAMAEYLGLSVEAFYKKHAVKKAGRWSLDEVKVGRKDDCVFLTRDATGKAGCSIYPVRPTQCRTWPFWDSNLTSPRAWMASAKTCPGMKAPDEQRAGTFVPVEQIRVRLDENPRGL